MAHATATAMAGDYISTSLLAGQLCTPEAPNTPAASSAIPVVAPIGDRVQGRRMDLAAGASVQVNSGAHRCAYGELVRYTDEAGIAYVRIALSPTQSAILVVRADTISPARVAMRASEMR